MGLYLQSLTLHKFFITIDSAVKKFSYSVELYRTENQRLCCIILGNRTVSNSVVYQISGYTSDLLPVN